MIAAPSYPNRAACLSRYSRISAIIGSSSGGVTSFLHELCGRAADCRPIARIQAYLINLRRVCHISDMPKIPCYQTLDAVRHCDSDVCSILDRLYRQGLGLGQLPTENFRQVAGMDDRERLQRREPVTRCLRVANSRCLNNQPGSNQFESRPLVPPPVPCGELVGQDTDIVSQSARQIAHHRRLHEDSRLDSTVTRTLLRSLSWGGGASSPRTSA